MTAPTIDEPVYLGFHDREDIKRLKNYRTLWDAPAVPVELHRVHGPVSRINIYLGANNSGKSRLLRALLHAQPSSGLLASARTLRTQAIDSLQQLGERYPASEELLSITMGRRPTYDHNYYYLVLPRIQWALEELDRWPLHTLLAFEVVNDGRIPGSRESPQFMVWWPQTLSFDLWKSIIVTHDDDLTDDEGSIPNHTSFESLTEHGKGITAFRDMLKKQISIPPAPRVYIPILRTAHTLHGCGSERDTTGDIFLKTIVENYGIEVTGDAPRIEVFTGLQLYDQILRDRCGPKHTRDRIDAFERFLGQQFFAGQSLEIVPRYTQDRAEQHIYVKIGGREERELHNLGDGINALILVLYKIFTADTGSWIFIEEPELNLHPGLQRIFLQTLLHDASVRERNLRIFLTTHSNHLVGMAMHHSGDISVFAVAPEATEGSSFLVRTVQGPELGLLDELGVDNASVFLANCSLWVEGVSDRIYLQGMLAAYARAKSLQLREDLDFAFFEYGGSNFMHYAFAADERDTAKIRAQFVSNRVFLLADSDDDPNKYTALQAATATVTSAGHFEFATTGAARTIENLLSLAALRAIFDHQRQAVSRHLTTLDPAILPWHTVTPEALLAGDFGEVFAGLLVGTSASGFKVLKHKTNLARAFALAVEAQQIGWDDLGEPARSLTLKIAAFIARHSPGHSPA